MKTVELRRIASGCVSFFTDVQDDDEQPLCTAVNEAVAKHADLVQSDLSGGYFNLADLRWAQLQQADLSRSFLYEANLEHAFLGQASLDGATLWGANLTAVSAWKADFQRADLRKANLSRADLQGADLRRADLAWATLTGADLSDAQLEYTNLQEANLDEIRADLWALLDRVPRDAAGLLAKLRAGEIAHNYECPCVGTVAALRGCKYDEVLELGWDGSRPIERWLLPLEAGDTPDTHPIAKITEGWIVEWIAAHSAS